MDEKVIKELGDKIQAKLDKFAADGKAMTDAAKLELKAEITDMVEKYNKLNDDFTALQGSVDTMSAESKRMKEAGGLVKGFTQLLNEKLVGEDFQKWLKGRKSGSHDEYKAQFDNISLKSITPSTATTATTAPQYINTIAHEPDRKTHVRDIIPTAPTSSNRVVLPVEATISDGTVTTAVGIAKGASQFTLDVQTFPVQKIAAALKISEEMLDDIPGLSAYITSRWMAKLKNKEDYELLYNTASSTEFGGLTTLAQAYVDTISDKAVNRWDVLRAAIFQAITDEYMPNYIVLNPSDVQKLLSEKGTDAHYIGGASPWNPAQLLVDGVPILMTTAIGAGEFLVGDFAQGCQIFDKMSANVRFYDQDEDNAQKNLITVIIEERLTLVTVRANAFVYGTFAEALAQGSGE